MSLLAASAAGIAALAAAYLGNKLIWRVFHGRGTAWLVPLWEETLKTSLGLLAGRLIAVHVIFGLGEAWLEARRGDWIAAGLAFISHMLFGFIAWLVWRGTGLPPAGWLAAAGAHLGWNRLILHFSRQ